MDDTPVLATGRLLLVPLDTRQLAARIASSDFTLRFALPGHASLGPVRFGPDHPGELLGLYPLWLAATPHPGQVPGTWTAIHRQAREAVGSLGAKTRPDEQGSVEIGYGFVPAWWGQGLATEAVAAMCHALLAQQVPLGAPVHSLTARTRPDNRASQRVLQHCGFVADGELLDPHEGRLLAWRLSAS